VADLWAAQREEHLRAAEPLALRMRPRTLDEVAGQQHLLGPGKLLRRMIEGGTITSLILHGPPGTGKTTLARVIAEATGRHLESENASNVGVARIREILEQARARLEADGRRSVLFLDEIHRFSRAQQDVLLPDVERGVITLIGATTENPLFSVNSALVSRSTLCRLEPLSVEDIVAVLRRAIGDPQRGYGRLALAVEEEALRVWAVKSDGDARRALGALEVAVLSAQARDAATARAESPGPIRISRADAEDSIQQKAAVYDATGDEHYDTISAFIKSVRGSDPDAAVYWLARMLDAGEDPRFIARRLAILASEDIGNADPRGLMVAAAGWELVERLGLPEARITLAQCTTYLALAPKSNASYRAIDEAMNDVRRGRTVAVPAPIKDGNVRLAAERSAGSTRGEAYQYAHDAPTAGAAGQVGGVTAQDYLGVSRRYYRPVARGHEAVLRERLEAVLAERARLRGEAPRPEGPGGGA
jgi:putative ATPase